MKQKKYILALDQGTTSSRAIIFNRDGKIVSVAQKEFKQYYPKPGWVEHDPDEIWSSQSSVTAEVIAKSGITTNEISSIGITNQRETVVVWNRETGRPVYRAIVWQDRRTAEACRNLLSEGKSEMIKNKTGLIIDAYFSATKVRWILDHVEGARERAEKGELCFGTVDSWLVWNFTRGKVHVTDITNASRTMLYNIFEDKWDPALLELFNIPESMLPEVKASSGLFATTSGDTTGFNLPITGIAGDQQAALFGQLCLDPGMIKNTYGTGCFMILNTGSAPVFSNAKLLTTIAWKLNNKITYALEGSIFMAGAVIQWLRDELQIIQSAEESESLANSVKNNDGVYLVPAFAGLGAPHWDQFARGTIVGLTRGTGKAHIARAALEGIGFQVADVLEAMQKDYAKPIWELRVDGGASVNNFLMQFQSDILNAKVTRPEVMETTALGAAYLAGLAAGVWKDTDELSSQWSIGKAYTPSMGKAERQKEINNWHRALDRSRSWINEDAE